MMKAAMINSHKEYVNLHTVPIPRPGPTQVLVKIHAGGCCHTDVHAIDGDWPVPSKLPLILGHEGVGHIVEIGSSVTNLKVGDRVGLPWLASACGSCEYCVSGWETLCTKQSNNGYSVDGGLSEYALSSSSHCIPIPDSIPYVDAAPILCAGVTSYKALKETEVKPGQYITIIGAAGGLGHLAVQYAKAMGMIPIAVDVGQDKLNFCLSLGASYAFDAKRSDLSSAISEITGGGCHGVLCLATSPSAFKLGVGLCRRKGTLVLVGLPSGGFDLNIFEIVLKRITVRGSIVGTREDLKEAFGFVERGQVKCTIQVEPFSKVGDVFNNLREGKIQGRVVLDIENA